MDFQGELPGGSSLKMSLFIMTIFTFLIPALLFTWLIFKKNSSAFLGLSKSPKLSWLAMVGAMLILLMPIIQFSFELNQGLPLPSWMSKMEDSANDTLIQLLQMEHLGHLLVNIGLIAILPALGEELLFRGVIQKYLYSIFAKPQISVWVTAFLFSAIHLQFEGFIPRFLLGLFLGYLYYWTKNLWLPIVAHFLNNAMMLVFAYTMPEDQFAVEEAALPDIPLLVVVLALVLLIPGIQFFHKIRISEGVS